MKFAKKAQEYRMAVELFPKHSNKYIKTGNNEGKHLRLSPVVVSIFTGLNKAPSPKEPPPALGLAAEERALHGHSLRQRLHSAA